MIKNPNKIKYFIYCRKSTEAEDCQMVSIDSQIDECQKLAQGLEVVGTFRESKSAKKPGRVFFNEMVSRIEKGEANGIIAWEINRLARNAMDGGKIQYLLHEGIIKHIKTFKGNFYPGDNSIVLAVEVGMSTEYSRKLSTDVTRGLRQKAQKGERPGLAPLGYKNTSTNQRGFEKIVVDENNFDLVRRMFDYVLTEKAVPMEVLRIANNQWGLRTRKGQKISKSNFYRVLTNPFYYGRYEYPKDSSNWYNGNQKKMITEEEYDRIQYILGKKGKPRPKSHIFAYTGLLKCGECGASITCEEKWKKQKNGNIHHYIYYHCTKKAHPNCTQKSIEEKVLDKEILNFLSKIEIPAEFHEWAIEELQNMHAIEKKDRNTILQNHQTYYDKCVKKLDTLLEMRMAGEINANLFSEKQTLLEKEKAQAKSMLNNIDKRVDDWIKTADNTLKFAEKARIEFAKGNLEKRKQILVALGSNHLLKDKILCIQTEKPLIVLQEAALEVKAINSRLEPAKIPLNKGDFHEICSQSPKWSG
jgi:DNA invertase Pin-like site-specific DNA recombinase/predicted metal-binding protein